MSRKRASNERILSSRASRPGVSAGFGAKALTAALRAAAPAPLTTTVLMNLAARQFGVTFPLARDRRSFNKSVGSSLRVLHRRGLIEPLHDRQQGSHGLWRWKAPVSSLDALRALVAANAGADVLAVPAGTQQEAP